MRLRILSGLFMTWLGMVAACAPPVAEKKDPLQNHSETDSLAVWTIDDFQGAESVAFRFPVPSSLSVIQKIERLADTLSTAVFSHLPITLRGVDTINGLAVALIDLSESDDPACGGMTWRSHYFQGSTGGGITTFTLTRSFLQENYNGQWADGIRFYYEGEPIEDGIWDHVFLHGIKYRSSPKPDSTSR